MSLFFDLLAYHIAIIVNRELQGHQEKIAKHIESMIEEVGFLRCIYSNLYSQKVSNEDELIAKAVAEQDAKREVHLHSRL